MDAATKTIKLSISMDAATIAAAASGFLGEEDRRGGG